MNAPEKSQMYADAAKVLEALARGERVEQRNPRTDHHEWHPFIGVFSIGNGWEYRIATEPPKAREFWLFPASAPQYHAYDSPRCSQGVVHVREVSPTLDAEIAELRRNEKALREAIRNLGANAYAEVLASMRKHEATL